MATSVKTFEHFSLHPGVSCKGWLLYFIIKDALVRFIHPSSFNAEMMREIRSNFEYEYVLSVKNCIYITKILRGCMCTQMCSQMTIHYNPLMTNYQPRTWRNTLCRPEINPRRGGTPSADRKSTRDVAEHPLIDGTELGYRI